MVYKYVCQNVESGRNLYEAKWFYELEFFKKLHPPQEVHSSLIINWGMEKQMCSLRQVLLSLCLVRRAK